MVDYPQEMANQRYPAMSATLVQNLTDVKMCSVGWTDESYREFYEIAQIVTGLIVYPIACTLGLVGNALTIFVLSRRNMLTSTNAFLSALAVSDSIKLVNDSMYILVTVLLRTDHDIGKVAYGYLYPYAHFVFSMSVSVSSWLTVSVAVERYILICHPTRARAFWNRRRAIILCVSIYLVMTILSMPSALRYRTIKCVDRKTSLSKVEVELTEIWQNQSLVTAYEWIQNLMRSTIPSLTLIVLNVCIISALRRTRAKRRNSRHRVTIMMIVVILVFLICITPDAILSTVFGFGYHEASYMGKAIREITDCLLTINASVNFIIYCVFNQTFRKSFAQIWCFNNRATGWVTQLDESVYRRLSEAKCLLSTNNNSSHRHTTPTKVFIGNAHHNGSKLECCPEEGVTLVTFDPQAKTINCHLANTYHGEIRRHSSPLISSSSSSTEPDNSLAHHHQHRMTTSSGLKKCQNSVKFIRAMKAPKVTFIDNQEFNSKKTDGKNENGREVFKSCHEDTPYLAHSLEEVYCDNPEGNFVNPVRFPSTNVLYYQTSSTTASGDHARIDTGIIHKWITTDTDRDYQLPFCNGSQRFSSVNFSGGGSDCEDSGTNLTPCDDDVFDVQDKDSFRLAKKKHSLSERVINAPTIKVQSENVYRGSRISHPTNVLAGYGRDTSCDLNRAYSSVASRPKLVGFDDTNVGVSSSDSGEIMTTDV